MYRIFSFTAAFMLMTLTLFGQPYHIEGKISGLNNADVYLVQAFATSKKIVDTARTNASGSFDITMGKNWPVGMYRVMTNTGQAFDLIYNHENIDFTTSGFGPGASFHILSSVENLIYYQYLGVKIANQKKINLLKPVLEYYPQNDPFYQVIKKQSEMLQQQIQSIATRLIKDNPNTIAAHFIRLDKPALIDFNLSPAQQVLALKRNYFKGVNFQDTLLLRTDLFTAKIVGYLTLFQTPGMSKPEVENAFSQAVDTLMEKTLVNEKLYEFTLNYLLNGFKEFGFHKLLLNIAKNNKLASFKDHSPNKLALEQKLAMIIKLAPGQLAPNFTARTIDGKKIRLYDVKADKTLLVFWASWCPHCTAALPKLKKYYNPSNTAHFQIIGISVDTNKKSVENAIKNEGYAWPNIAQLKGWNSPIAVAYGVTATPTFVLLNKNKRIIAKPLSVEELGKYLR